VTVILGMSVRNNGPASWTTNRWFSKNENLDVMSHSWTTRLSFSISVSYVRSESWSEGLEEAR